MKGWDSLKGLVTACANRYNWHVSPHCCTIGNMYLPADGSGAAEESTLAYKLCQSMHSYRSFIGHWCTTSISPISIPSLSHEEVYVSSRDLFCSLHLFFIFHFFFRMKIIEDVWRVYVGPKLKFQKISSSIPTIRLFRVGFAYYDDNDCMLSECGALLCIVLCYVRYLRHFPATKTIHARLHATST